MKNIFLFLLLIISSQLTAQTWAPYGSGLEYPVNSICYHNNTLYAAGGGVYSWNGSSWNDRSNGMISLMDVYSLASYNGSLYAGGFFTVLTPDFNWYNNAGRFYNNSWTTCGTGTGNDAYGFSDYVNFLYVFNGQLYAGGRFGSAGGDPLSPQTAPYIASFDGTLWHPVGSGMDFTVTDLVEYNGQLIASGFFTTAGGVPANYIARWNGSVWSSFGSGMNGKVTALAVFNGELYAGGLFTQAGGVPALSIAKWNGTSWSQVGNGIAGGAQVYTLAVYKDELYAGGNFSTGSGNAGNNIMKWNGTEWKNVGSGTNGPVVYLYSNSTELILGGNFSNAGGTAAKNIAVYTGLTGLSEDISAPDKFILEQNYPNPFNPSTRISWHIPSASHVLLKIYDLLGNDIATLFDGEIGKGSHEVEWDASGFSGGIYICHLIAGNSSDTRKIVLIK
jgi:trimeric autotransporter adhesin